MTTYRFLGHVLDETTHRGLPGLRVEAWDAEAQTSDLVAVAITDAQGAFALSLDDTYLTDLFQTRPPTVVFRIFTTTAPIQRLTSRYLLWKLVTQTTSGRIKVSPQRIISGDTPAPGVVRGVLLTTAGAPIPGATVSAYDQGLAAETLLGTGVTDAAGSYRITYARAPSGRAGKLAPDVVVRAADATGTALAASSRVCHAPATAAVNLTSGGVFRGPSELDALNARIASHVTGFDLRTATADHLEHLACASGSNPVHVSALATATTLAAATSVPLEIHYALLREGLPATRRELLLVPPAALRSSVQTALAKNTIPASFTATLDASMAQLRQAAVTMAFDAPPAGATGNLGGLVATVLSTGDAHTFLDKYLAHDGAIEDFWTTLPQQMTLPSQSTPGDLQLALQLGALTRFHFPLITQLQTRRANGAIASLRDLAKYSEADWTAALDQVQNGQAIGFPADVPGIGANGQPDPNVQKANYARVLRRTMETAFPTAAIAGDIARPGLAADTDIGTFFTNNQGFELGKTRVAHHVAANSGAMQGVTDVAGTVNRLKQIELLSKITPRYSDMQRFLADGLHSAREVVRLGKAAFLSKYAPVLGPDVAEESYARAHHTAAHALAHHAKYAPDMNPASAYALPNFATSTTGPQAPAAADWTTLFGSPDFCDCEHCNSVYGPAAYFVDLLQFLGGSDANVAQSNNHPTAKDVLLLKRPDLANVDLTCDNTLTALPYVDLVNEILEHIVAAGPTYPAHIGTVGTTEDLQALPAVVSGVAAPRPAFWT